MAARVASLGRTTKRAFAHAAIAITSISSISPCLATAGEAERTQAELVFQKAVEKLAKGEPEAACALFEESDRIDPQPGTEYELAKCYVTIGRHASAWARFRAVAERLDAKGEREKAEKIRRLVETTVEPKLARLTITVPDAIARAAGLDVKRDGVPIGKAMWGAASPVDPGVHRIKVSAEKKVPWEATVTIDPAGSATVTVPDLADEALAPPEPVKPVTPAPAAPPPPPAFPTQRKVAIAAGAAGALGLAIGIGFGVAAMSKASTWQTLVDKGCDNPRRDCQSPELVATIRGVERDRSAFASASTIGIIAGGAAALGGVALWLTTPRNSLSSLTIAPSFIGGDRWLVARGSF